LSDTRSKKLDTEILNFIARGGRVSCEEKFEALAFKIFSYQFEKNLNYKKFCVLEGKTPSNVSSWKEIPAIPAAGFKELALATFPVRRAVKIFKTSGTTQRLGPIPGRGVHFFDTLKLYGAAVLPPFRKYLLPDSGPCSFYFLMPSPTEAPESSLSYMMGIVNRSFAAGQGRYYVKKGELLLKRLATDLQNEKKKVFLASTAFALKTFLDDLEQRKCLIRLPAASRLMETGGFKGRSREVSKKALYGACEKFLGIQKDYCVSEYGMTELSSQFYDTTLHDAVLKIKRKSFKAGPPWTRTLVMDPRTGREAKRGAVGFLRHFDLANRGSVLALQTEDLGRVVGVGFELLGRAPGSVLRGCSLSYEEFLRS